MSWEDESRVKEGRVDRQIIGSSICKNEEHNLRSEHSLRIGEVSEIEREVNVFVYFCGKLLGSKYQVRVE